MVRRRKWNVDGGVNLGIIITPMLDMAFQLLAFFIMTYHPSPSEAAVDGTLLPAAPGQHHTASDGAIIQVVVKANSMGQPTAIYLKRPSQEARLIATIAMPGNPPPDFDIALPALAKELAIVQARTDEKDLPVLIDGDRKLHYGNLIAVQDVAKAAMFKQIELRATNHQGEQR